MADFHPFRGITYNPARISLADALCPPYHMVSSRIHHDLLAAESHNAVQFVAGNDAAAYRASADAFSGLLRDGILVRNSEPTFYIIARSYKDSAGVIRQRVGVTGLCRLEDFSSGIVHPHLKTIPRIREDRFRQIQMMNANTTPVLALCNGNGEALTSLLQEFMAEAYWAEITLEESIIRVWQKTDRKSIEKIRKTVQHSSLILAEGHHAYEAALAYRDMMHLGRPAPDEPFNYIMMCIEEHLSAATIFPVHRIIHPLKPVDWERVAIQLAKYFKLKPVESVEQMHLAFAKRTKHTFGMIRNSGMWLCVLVDPSRIKELVGDTVPAEIRPVDAGILHSFFLDHVLHIDIHDQLRLDCVQYVHSVSDAVTMVGEEKAEVAFVLPPVQPDEIAAVVRNNALLPPRATWFYPQLPSGLVMRRLDERIG